MGADGVIVKNRPSIEVAINRHEAMLCLENIVRQTYGSYICRFEKYGVFNIFGQCVLS